MTDSIRWFLGVDWATEAHDTCLTDVTGKVHWERHVRHDVAAVHAFLDMLLSYTGAAPEQIAVAIETPRGALVDAFIERGFDIASVNPKQVDRFRDRFTTAGAKDDARDAWVLADARRTDPRAFHPVRPDAPAVVELRELTRGERDLTAQLARLTNQLREQIYRVAPPVLTLTPAADEPWFWTLLEHLASPTLRKTLTQTDIRKLLKDHRIRRWDAETVWAKIHAPRFHLAAGVETATWTHVDLLVPQIRVVDAQRRRCAKLIEGLLKQMAEAGPSETEPGEHRDVTVFQSLPGVGRTITATMFAEAPQALARRDYATLRLRTGVAPVTKKSGKRKKRPFVLMRRACSPELRNACYHWGRVSIQVDTACRRHYDHLRHRGHSHGRALRGVVDRLLRIAIAMLKHRTLYNADRLVAVVAA